MARYKGSGTYIYFDGEFVPEADAKVHVLSGAVKYAALVFEGMVGYLDGEGRGVNVFRLPEHMNRLLQSMHLMRFEHDYTVEGLSDVVLETLRHNEVQEDAHIRLSAFVNGASNIDARGPISLACSVQFRPGLSLDEKAARAAVSSWRRIDDTSMPPRIKTSANYNNGRLGMIQAKDDGYDEVIFLTREGKVAEASSSCIFVVRDGTPMTSTATHGILESITRDTIIQLCVSECGAPAIQREIDRTELYLVEEAFLCGSGYEITPIVNIDGMAVGEGTVGPLTRQVWQAYEAAVRGRIPAKRGWLIPVDGRQANSAAAE